MPRIRVGKGVGKGELRFEGHTTPFRWERRLLTNLLSWQVTHAHARLPSTSTGAHVSTRRSALAVRTTNDGTSKRAESKRNGKGLVWSAARIFQRTKWRERRPHPTSSCLRGVPTSPVAIFYPPFRLSFPPAGCPLTPLPLHPMTPSSLHALLRAPSPLARITRDRRATVKEERDSEGGGGGGGEGEDAPPRCRLLFPASGRMKEKAGARDVMSTST